MLRLIQILTYFRNNNFTESMILDELHEIMDNESLFFQLTEKECIKISDIYNNETKFKAAWNTVFIN